MPIPMISNAGHIYNKRSLRANDEFEANDETDASDLETLGFATRKKVVKESDEPASAPADDTADAPAPAEASGGYATRQLQEATPTPDYTYGDKKERYNRRDKRAQK